MSGFLFGRHLSKLFVVPIALATIAMPITAMGQEAGNTVTMNLVTCTVTGTAPSAGIATSPNPSGAGRDCVEGWPASASLLLDGSMPDASESTVLVWHGVDDGGHELSANGAAAISGETVMIDGVDLEMWATFYTFERGPEPTTPSESGDETSQDSADTALDNTSTKENAGGVQSLPKTGVGEASTTPEGTWALLAASIAGVGAHVTRRWGNQSN